MFKYYIECLIDDIKSFLRNEKRLLFRISILLAIIITLILSCVFYRDMTSMILQFIFFNVIYVCIMVVIGIALFLIIGVLCLDLMNKVLDMTKYETLVLTLMYGFNIILVILSLIIYVKIILSTLKSIYFPVCRDILSLV